MSFSDNASDKDFFMSESDTSENAIEQYDIKTYETLKELYRKSLSLPLIIVAAGFLIIVILLIAVIFRGQDLAEKKQISAIEERLDLMAKKLDRVETIVASKMDQVISELERDDQTTVIQSTPTAKTPPTPKKEQKDVKPKIHKVQAGDTLYEISRHYGLSIAQLRAYNKLKSNAKIYPGQELKLTP